MHNVIRKLKALRLNNRHDIIVLGVIIGLVFALVMMVIVALIYSICQAINPEMDCRIVSLSYVIYDLLPLKVFLVIASLAIIPCVISERTRED